MKLLPILLLAITALSAQAAPPVVSTEWEKAARGGAQGLRFPWGNLMVRGGGWLQALGAPASLPASIAL